jgi:acetyl esterase/lipase
LTERFASPGGEELVADTYIPEAANRNRAAVIFVHGGGWNAGARHQFRWHAHRLSLHGYFACTIDYRLTRTAPFPAAVKDCQAAVRWLRGNAKRFDISADRIAAFGSSAGGHLAACLGVFEDPVETVSSKVNCVVDIHGVHDFIAALDPAGNIKEHWEAFLGGPVSAMREAWMQASPALHVDGNSAPMLLAHDPGDDVVPCSQSHILAAALMKAGRGVEFMPSPGSGHGYVYNPANAWTQKVWPAAVSWLDDHLTDAAAIRLSC